MYWCRWLHFKLCEESVLSIFSFKLWRDIFIGNVGNDIFKLWRDIFVGNIGNDIFKLWRVIFFRNVGNNMLSEIWAFHRDHCELCAYKRNFEACSRNHFCSDRSLSTTYSLCVSVALIIQHAMRMRHTILPSVACLFLAYFFYFIS